MNAGSAVPSMTTEILNNMPIVIAPNAVFIKYDELATSLFNAISSRRKQNETLATLRDTLLPKLMSGEIEVPVAEAILQERS